MVKLVSTNEILNTSGRWADWARRWRRRTEVESDHGAVLHSHAAAVASGSPRRSSMHEVRVSDTEFIVEPLSEAPLAG